VGRCTGRRILVTGASSGIGEATARALAAEGAQVGLLARRAEALEVLADDLDGVAVVADVVDADATRTAVDTAAERLGGLDGLVNAAGLVRPARVADAAPSDWRRMLDVNVLGLLQVTQAAIRHMRSERRGDVVNVSSMSGRRLQTPEMGVYGATKAAVHTLSEGLRRELSAQRIRVSVIAPGLVDTPIFEGLEDPVATRLRDAAPSAGLRAAEVAEAIVEVVAAPEHLMHVEVALLSLDQS
jgi:NADP-dependent 3-hydroxy acid dehydrogenase YdfG